VPNHSHLSEGMRIATLLHTELAEQLAMIRASVCSVVVFVLRHSPTKAFRVEVVDELVTEFQKLERQSCLEKPFMRVCALILGPPSGRPD
jgi:hypothetical protein